MIRASDAIDSMRAQGRSLTEAVAASQSLVTGTVWTDREREAKQLIEAARALHWTAGDSSLIGAGLQDWLRTTAFRAGLNVREIQAARRSPGGGRLDASALLPFDRAGAATPDEALVSALQRDGLEVWRVRMVIELRRSNLVAFLNEVAGSPRPLVVERLAFRNIQPGGVVEIELRALGRVAPGVRQ